MGVGDFKEETFSDEEKAALGEAEEVKAPDAEKPELKETEPDIQTDGKPKGEETSEGDEQVETEPKAEPTAEELAAAETKGARFEDGFIIDEDGERIPLKRFREVYREAKEGERTKEKFDLFKKLGPDKFYEVYPDEKPEGWQPETVPLNADIDLLTVDQPGGPYHGMTLREVKDIDSDFAADLRADFRAKQRIETELEAVRQKTEAERKAKEATDEVNNFGNALAKGMFGKESGALSKDEYDSVGKVLAQVHDWREKTGLVKRLDHAYVIMHQEGILKKVAETAAQRTLRSIQERKGPMSIDTTKSGDVRETGFEAYEKMTETELTRKIDAMPDKELAKFFKEAPKSLRAKHPKLPWD